VEMTVVGLIILIGGVWLAQDSIASILYYLHKPNERWVFNHAVRILRLIWSVIFVILGVSLLI